MSMRCSVKMLALKLLTFFISYTCANAADSYTEVRVSTCLHPDARPLVETTTTNSRQCAVQCSNTAMCAAFQFIQADLSCLLYTAVHQIFALHAPSNSSGNCTAKFFAGYLKVPGYATFTSSGRFTVLARAASLKILAIGGGSGGCAACSGGGGSGFVNFAALSVSAGQTFTVTVGSGGLGGKEGYGSTGLCNGATNGSDSTFGNILIARGGTNSGGFNGGDGGSGGGSGTCGINGLLSGHGGSAGSAGKNSNNSYIAGSGQGASFTSWFTQFKLAIFTTGLGANGTLSDSNYRYGGGGGGGILLNGTGPSSGAGQCCDSTSCGPSNATGYGAGGSAACRDMVSLKYFSGGKGSDGLVYIEYN